MNQNNTFGSWDGAKKAPCYEKAIVTDTEDFVIRPYIWVLPEWLARKKVHLLTGFPGVGKGAVLYSIIARVSRGGTHPSWPNLTPTVSGTVVIISFEDDPSETIVPKILAAGGDLKKTKIIMVVNRYGTTKPVDLATDFEMIIAALQEIEDLVLVVIDPLINFFGGKSSNAKVQLMMSKLAKFAEDLNCAILCVTHTSKSARSSNALSNVSGALAVGSVPRLVMQVTKDRKGEGSTLTRIKSNIGPDGGGFMFNLEKVNVSQGGIVVPTTKVMWGEKLEGSAADILKMLADESAERGKKKELAKEFLKDQLSHSPKLVSAVREAAELAGISKATLERAFKELGGISRKLTNEGQASGFEWSLPSGGND